jgi:hypothetical protein
MPGADSESLDLLRAEERANERYRLRDRDTRRSDSDGEARGRRPRRHVANPFVSPVRRQPSPIDAYVGRGYGFGYPVRPVETPVAAPQAVQDSVATQDPTRVVLLEDDVDMGYGDSRDYGRVLNAPAIPLPPTYRGSTKAERRAFMREYQK